MRRLSIAEQEAVQKDTRSEEHDVERALAISLAGLLTEVARDQQDPSDSATAASSSRPTSTTATNTNHQSNSTFLNLVILWHSFEILQSSRTSLQFFFFFS